MAGEEWTRRIVEKELKRAVKLNDDGSAPGMYDLRIGPLDAPEIAIECVGAVDRTFTETWNIGPARGPLEISIRGDWIITITASARVKIIKQHIEQLLQELEARKTPDVYVDYWLKWRDAKLFNRLESLGITHASCYRLQGTGKVHFGMPGIGGAVDSHGKAVSEWIGSFLRDSARQDVLFKLGRSGAKDCHVFLLVGFGGAPWPVESYLAGELEQFPIQTPDLPQPVTGVWIVHGLSRKGLRWDGVTWRLFDTPGEGIDS